MTEQQMINETRADMVKAAKQDGLCTSFHVFKLGANGTAMVSCGMPAGHERTEDLNGQAICWCTGEKHAHDPDGDWGESCWQDAQPLSKHHLTKQEFDDGSAVVYRWEA